MRKKCGGKKININFLATPTTKMLEFIFIPLPQNSFSILLVGFFTNALNLKLWPQYGGPNMAEKIYFFDLLFKFFPNTNRPIGTNFFFQILKFLITKKNCVNCNCCQIVDLNKKITFFRHIGLAILSQKSKLKIWLKGSMRNLKNRLNQKNSSQSVN